MASALLAHRARCWHLDKLQQLFNSLNRNGLNVGRAGGKRLETAPGGQRIAGTQSNLSAVLLQWFLEIHATTA